MYTTDMRKAVRAIVIKDNALLVMHRNKFGQEFYALVGGGIDMGETPEAALYREVAEEASLQITNHRLVVVEDAGDMFGIQYIYTADYVGGEPALQPDSPEALIQQAGQNLYTPMWLPLDQLASVMLLPKELQQLLVQYCPDSWPAEPIELTVPS